MSDGQDNVILQSTKWSAIGEFLAKVMTPLINIILARVLAPTQFGLVATFTVVIAFAEVFTDAGFQKYLVQHDFESRKELEDNANVAFWTNLSLSVVFWCVILAFKESIAVFVGSAGYGNAIVVLSLQIPLVAFSSIQTALFRRDFRFKQLLPIRLAVSMVPLLVTVPLAFVLKNCWAIVIGNLSKELVNAILLTAKSKWRPSFFYKLRILQEMLSDTLWLMADSLMIWATTYAGTLVLSRRLDVHYLGLYKTGATTIAPYMNMIYTMTAPVLFSALSRLQHNKKERDRVFFTYQHYAANFVMLLGVAIFSFRDMVTLLLLGSNWIEATTVIGATGVSMTITVVIGQYNSDYFRAAGKPYVALTVQTIYVCIIMCALSWAVSRSFLTLSLVGGLMGLSYGAVSSIAMWKIFGISPMKTVFNVKDSLLAAVLFFVTSQLLRRLIGEGLICSGMALIVSSMVYMAVLLIFPSNRQTYQKLSALGRVLNGNKVKSAEKESKSNE